MSNQISLPVITSNDLLKSAFIYYFLEVISKPCAVSLWRSGACESIRNSA